MEMDPAKKAYNEAEYKGYIHGSPEAIGLMCLCVFCEGDKQLYLSLSPMACSLGAAFQKVNFLRDIKADYEERGRTYFPAIDLKNFTAHDKHNIETDIKANFDGALIRIKHLPAGAKLGVYIAYNYYLQLFKKICSTPAGILLQKRIRIPGIQKRAIYGKALLKQKLNMI